MTASVYRVRSGLLGQSSGQAVGRLILPFQLPPGSATTFRPMPGAPRPWRARTAPSPTSCRWQLYCLRPTRSC